VIYLKTEKQGIAHRSRHHVQQFDYSENIHSYVNNINTDRGWYALWSGFRTALTRVLKKYAEDEPGISKQIEKAKVEIAPEDFREGLTAVHLHQGGRSLSSRVRPRPSSATAR
jgi:DNA gyrase subunit B